MPSESGTKVCSSIHRRTLAAIAAMSIGASSCAACAPASAARTSRTAARPRRRRDAARIGFVSIWTSAYASRNAQQALRPADDAERRRERRQHQCWRSAAALESGRSAFIAESILQPLEPTKVALFAQRAVERGDRLPVDTLVPVLETRNAETAAVQPSTPA